MLCRSIIALCVFDKFHLTFNFKSEVLRDVFKNKNECQLTCAIYSRMSSQLWVILVV